MSCIVTLSKLLETSGRYVRGRLPGPGRSSRCQLSQWKNDRLKGVCLHLTSCESTRGKFLGGVVLCHPDQKGGDGSNRKCEIAAEVQAKMQDNLRVFLSSQMVTGLRVTNGLVSGGYK